MNREELDETLPLAGRAGVFSLPAGDTALINEAATALGMAVFRVDLAGCGDKDEVLGQIAAALQFPAWFGCNWDALTDCLTDMSWREATGYVLILENLGEFQSRDEDEFDTFIEVLSEASASWSGMGIPFWAFLVLGQ